MAIADVYRRLESLTGGTPGAAPSNPPIFRDMAALKRFAAEQAARGNEHAGRVLLAAKESEQAGRAREFLRAVNMTRLNRCDVPGEIMQPARRRR